MNKKMNLPQLQKVMMQFKRESEIMDLKEETIFPKPSMTDDDEEESEVIVQQVLDGISLDHELSRNLTSNRLRHRRRQWRQ